MPLSDKRGTCLCDVNMAAGKVKHMMSAVDRMIGAKAVMAPMAGVTDAPFRAICRKFGCAFAFTEMVDVNGIAYNNRKTMKYLDRERDNGPLGAQIVGSDERRVIYAARVCEEKGFDLIDLNAGCPARKVVKAGKGAALLKSPLLLGKLVEGLVKSVSLPVTVKMRIGWDKENVNYMETVKAVESAGAASICVHPRTQEEMYKGRNISYDPIKDIKEAVKIPVFASGNIFTSEDAFSVMENTGCDGVFLARGVLGRPWIFRDICRCMEGIDKDPEPDIEQTKNIMMEHFSLSQEIYGELLTSKRMYKHVTWYFKGFKNLNEIMKVYAGVTNARDFRLFLSRIKLDGRMLILG